MIFVVCFSDAVHCPVDWNAGLPCCKGLKAASSVCYGCVVDSVSGMIT